MVPIRFVPQILALKLKADTPNNGKIKKTKANEAIFSKNGLLRTPYRLPTMKMVPKNQTKGAVNKKKTTGSLNILIIILFPVLHP